MRRLPHMLQVIAPVRHARGIPPPQGFVFDEQKQAYVEQDSDDETSPIEGR
jgi:hypothetical protein